MRKKRPKQSSIVNKLISSIILVIILQTIIFAATLIGGGVIKQANLNAYQLFHDKVSSRQDYLQTEMKNKWINFDPYLKNIEGMIEEENQLDQDIAEQLIQIIRNAKVTGAYVILLDDHQIQDHLPAIYLRDYDPIMNNYSDDDIYMVAGSSELAKAFNMPLDQLWKPYFEVNDYNEAFIKKPYESTFVTSRSDLLGYWSQPFILDEGDVEFITYSIPFLDQDGQALGIVGIEISLDYLRDYLPTTELQPQDSLGYLIAYRENEDSSLRPIIMHGALQKRMIDQDMSLDLKEVNEDMHLYELENHLGVETLYVVASQIGLYQNNTPFEEEEWYLIGIMREDYLLSYSNQIKQILWLSLITAIVLGGVGGIYISYQATKPIVKLSDQVRKNEYLRFDKSGYEELDQLSSAIERAHEMALESASRLSKIVNMFDVPIAAYEINKRNQSYYITDNFWKILGLKDEEMTYDVFIETMDQIFIETHQNDLFQIQSVEDKWIKHNRLEQNDAIIGAIVDMSEEVLEKKRIEYERDHDPLTKILNRKGFQWEFEKWYDHKSDDLSALIMFDLDNLKGVNDQFGHKWGDIYITTFVDHLREIHDSKYSIVGRRSGDEFLCLLYGFNDKDQVRNILEDFYVKLKSYPIDFPQKVTKAVGVSAGLIWIEDRSLEYDQLLHYADEALYEAKQSTKNTYIESQRI